MDCLPAYCTGILRASQVLKRFSPYMPRPPTPAESPASCLYRCFLVGFQSIYTVALRFDNVTRLNSFRDGAAPLTACMVPCVRLRCVVHLLGSFTTPTLSTGGWLFLTRQGLSPCKKRQAFLGAQTGVPGGGSHLQRSPIRFRGTFPWGFLSRSGLRPARCFGHPRLLPAALSAHFFL